MVMFLNSGGEKFKKTEKLPGKLADFVSNNLKEKEDKKELAVYDKILHPKKEHTIQLIKNKTEGWFTA